jgi:hypothetical protein
VRPPDLDGRHQSEVRAHGPGHGQPHHQACRCRYSCRQEGGFGLNDVFVLSGFAE